MINSSRIRFQNILGNWYRINSIILHISVNWNLLWSSLCPTVSGATTIGLNDWSVNIHFLLLVQIVIKYKLFDSYNVLFGKRFFYVQTLINHTIKRYQCRSGDHGSPNIIIFITDCYFSLEKPLRHNSIRISREWYGFTNMMQTTKPSHQSFEAVAESCVRYGTVFSEVEVSIEDFGI